MEIDLMNLSKVKSIEHTIEPSWASDAGRNSNSGKFTGTFIGWFDSLKIEVGKTTKEEMKELRNILESPIIENIKFRDSRTGEDKVENFYGSSITALLKNKNGNYEPFSIELQAVERRSDY